MYYMFFLFLAVTTNIKICESVDDNDKVYKNMYGYKDYNYTFTESIIKLATGVLKFVKEGKDLLSKETENTTPEFDEEYDFIVVGAGSAGSAVAARLSEADNVTVLLIEAGGEENLLFDVPLTVQYLQFSHLINWRYETESSTTYCLGMKEQRCKWPRGRVMGGSNVLNYMIATRGHPLDYDEWADMGNTGWSYDTLKYFVELEIYHQSGTCKMAPENDPSGVVNPRLQVKGVKGLRVADASIMPKLVTGHTHLPIVMIAEKSAEMVEDWGLNSKK